MQAKDSLNKSVPLVLAAWATHWGFRQCGYWPTSDLSGGLRILQECRELTQYNRKGGMKKGGVLIN
jgi:hypothetical protein